MRDVSRVVGDMYRAIVQSDSGPGGEGAGDAADRRDYMRPPSV